MTYTKVGPFVNDALPALNATNLNQIEQGVYDAQPEVMGWYNVRHYGAIGAAAGSQTADSAAFSAAFAAANAAGGGTVYIPPGIYYITSRLTQNAGVHVVGAGKMITYIYQLGTGVLFDGTGAPPSIMHNRKWEGFTLDGSFSGNGSEAIRAGNTYGLKFVDLLFWHYYYTSGMGIHLRNTSGGFSEGVSMYDVMTRDCAVGIKLSADGSAGTASFSNLAMYNVVPVMQQSGQVGISLNAGGTEVVGIYTGYLDLKTHGEVGSTYGMSVGPGCHIEESRLHWVHEAWAQTAYPLQTVATSRVHAEGHFQIATFPSATVDSAVNSSSTVQIGRRYSIYGPAPTIATGTALGTSGQSATIAGHDEGGVITLVVGSGASAVDDATAATVTFNRLQYTAQPNQPPVSITLTPANKAARILTTTMPYIDSATITDTQFVIKKPAATAFTAGTYKFYYQMMP